MEKSLLKEVYKMFIGVFSLSVIMVIAFWALGYFDVGVILGALIGSVGCVLNYFFLALSINKVVRKDGSSVKGFMGASYTLRMLFIAVVIILAIKLPNVNYVAAVIPFLFPRIVIMILNLKAKKTSDTSEKGGDNV